MVIHREFAYFIKDLYQRRFLIAQMVQREVKTAYTGSFLGPLWIIIEPLVFMFILWFLFTKGFRSGNVGDVPFVVHLTCGMVAWQYFAETFNSSTGLIRRYSFLVKKVDFRLGILPIVNVISTAISHIILVAIVLGIAVVNGFGPTLYLVQIGYYFFAMVVLLVGLSWFVSALNVFVSDTANLVGIVVQFGFWLTPVFWQPAMIPERYRVFIQMNPMYYIVSGYRDSIFLHVPFWDRPYLTVYFWFVASLTLLLGAIVFKRLRPHFAQVL